MLNSTVVGAYAGFAIFMAGAYARQYMHNRIVGGYFPLRIVRGLSEKYKFLIREDKAPLWPLILFRICIPLGIVVTFASIFLTPSLQ